MQIALRVRASPSGVEVYHFRVCSGTTYERPDTCLRKQRRKQAAGLLSSVTSCILDTLQRFHRVPHNRNFQIFTPLVFRGGGQEQEGCNEGASAREGVLGAHPTPLTRPVT
jgi:hypothetical protein